IVAPDRFRDLRFRISPPKTAVPGTYLVVMRLQAALPDSFFQAEGPKFLPEIDVLFFLKVKSLSLEDAAKSDNYRAEILSLLPNEAHHVGWLESIFAPKASAGV